MDPFSHDPSIIKGFSKIKISGFIINALAMCNFAWPTAFCPWRSLKGSRCSSGLNKHSETYAYLHGFNLWVPVFLERKNEYILSCHIISMFIYSILDYFWYMIYFGSPIKLHHTQMRVNPLAFHKTLSTTPTVRRRQRFIDKTDG